MRYYDDNIATMVQETLAENARLREADEVHWKTRRHLLDEIARLCEERDEWHERAGHAAEREDELREENQTLVEELNVEQGVNARLREENERLRGWKEEWTTTELEALADQRDTLLATLREVRPVLGRVEMADLSDNDYAAIDHAQGIIRRAISEVEGEK